MKKYFRWPWFKMRRSSLPTLWGNDKGVTFAEALVAAGIFSIAILGLSVSLVQLGNSRKKMNIVNSAISLQSYILEDIANPGSYPDDATKRALLVSGDVAGIDLTVTYPDVNGDPQTVNFKPPNAANLERYFKADLTICASASFADPDCVIKASLRFQGNQIAATPKYFYTAAYQITVNPSTEINVGNFGATNWPPLPTDFSITLPDLAHRVEASKTGCDPATDVAIRGVDRDTGQVTCILKPDPAQTCPAGRIPRSFKIVANRLTLDCADADTTDDVRPRVFTCPAEYSLQVIPNQQNFFQWTPVDIALTSPMCVFRGAESQGGFAVPADSALSGPPNFMVNNVPGTLSVPTVTVTDGVCPRPPIGVSYEVSGVSCSSVDYQTFQGGCCQIPGCAASFVNFPFAGGDPPVTVGAANADEVSCSVTTVAYWDSTLCHPDQTGCPGATPAYKVGRVRFTGPATCTRDISRPETVPAAASTP